MRHSCQHINDSLNSTKEEHCFFEEIREFGAPASWLPTTSAKLVSFCLLDPSHQETTISFCVYSLYQRCLFFLFTQRNYTGLTQQQPYSCLCPCPARPPPNLVELVHASRVFLPFLILSLQPHLCCRKRS